MTFQAHPPTSALRKASALALATCLSACGNQVSNSGPASPSGSPATSAGAVPARTVAAPPTWDPGKTRVFVASLAQFEGEEEKGRTSFSTDDRNDGEFAALLEKRGVPKANILLLLDRQATTEGVKRGFTAHLAQSRPDETLVFYYSSHGGYDADTGRHTFSSFDGGMEMAWALDTIEKDFKGSKALLFSDSCYSGGLVELAKARKGRVSYAALSSTDAHNVAWSRWRFFETVMRGLRGEPLLDRNADGAVDFGELATFTEAHMAFAADGKPIHATTGTLTPSFVVAKAAGPRPGGRAGEKLEVEWHGKWYRAEIHEEKGDQLLIHYTSSHQHKDDEWVGPERTRPFDVGAGYPVGERVEIQAASGKWYPATVMARHQHLHQCHYEGYTAAWDKWVSPNKIRPLAAK